jgi:hypothetical protein
MKKLILIVITISFACLLHNMDDPRDYVKIGLVAKN